MDSMQDFDTYIIPVDSVPIADSSFSSKLSIDTFFKTKFCPNIVTYAYCRRENNCPFAHCPEELRPLPDLRKTKLCKRFSETGTCIAEDKCPFAHGREELRNATSTHLSGSRASQPPSSFDPSWSQGQLDGGSAQNGNRLYKQLLADRWLNMLEHFTSSVLPAESATKMTANNSEQIVQAMFTSYLGTPNGLGSSATQQQTADGSAGTTKRNKRGRRHRRRGTNSLSHSNQWHGGGGGRFYGMHSTTGKNLSDTSSELGLHAATASLDRPQYQNIAPYSTHYPLRFPGPATATDRSSHTHAGGEHPNANQNHGFPTQINLIRNGHRDSAIASIASRTPVVAADAQPDHHTHGYPEETNIFEYFDNTTALDIHRHPRRNFYTQQYFENFLSHWKKNYYNAGGGVHPAFPDGISSTADAISGSE